jgi:hypothetical protein
MVSLFHVVSVIAIVYVIPNNCSYIVIVKTNKAPLPVQLVEPASKLYSTVLSNRKL